jgi:hypothetical protein
VAPGGIGVREFFLTLLLAPEVADLAGLEPAPARAAVVLTVLVLRLTWTVAELLLSGVLYVSGQRSAVSAQRDPDPALSSAPAES